MRKRTGTMVEIDSLRELDAILAAGATHMSGWRIQDVDLRERTEALLALESAGALLLGCDLTAAAHAHLTGGGALIFPDLPDLPFDSYRNRLYTAPELYAGLEEHSYSRTPDAVIYGWSRQRDTAATRLMAQALHDHAVDAALDVELDGAAVVGVMGGHAVRRGHDDYREAARLGRRLARADLCVVTGGGPGAMEAANLGACLSSYDDAAMDDAIAMLAPVADFRPSVTRWARSAFAVLARWPDHTRSLGIPTWFYGHEPPGVFATGIAKYFQNAVREDTLLRRCDAGIVFLPGAAGTVQEIFQDACENYYADPATVASMVLVGGSYWTKEVPVWQLLSTLAKGRPMSKRLHLVDDLDEAVEIIRP